MPVVLLLQQAEEIIKHNLLLFFQHNPKNSSTSISLSLHLSEIKTP